MIGFALTPVLSQRERKGKRKNGGLMKLTKSEKNFGF
jgi:hypothetical protein